MRLNWFKLGSVWLIKIIHLVFRNQGIFLLSLCQQIYKYILMFDFKDIFVYFYVINSFSAVLFIYEIQQTCQCGV